MVEAEKGRLAVAYPHSPLFVCFSDRLLLLRSGKFCRSRAGQCRGFLGVVGGTGPNHDKGDPIMAEASVLPLTVLRC